MTNVINMLLFQGAWFACVAGAAAGRWWLGLVALVPLVAHFVFAMRDVWGAQRSLAFLGAFAVLGALLEWVQTSVGTYAFATTTQLEGCTWMAALWLGFATTLPMSLRWLARRPLPAAIGGFVFGPLSFYAGARLGAIELEPGLTQSLVVLAVVWGLAFPLAGLRSERMLRTRLA